MKKLALKKRESTPEPVAPVVKAANAAGIDTRSRTSTVQPDGSKPRPPFRAHDEATEKSENDGDADDRKAKPKKKGNILTEGGLTPLGREAADSLKKNGFASAARTVGRGIAKEVVDSFESKPKKLPMILERKKAIAPLKKATLPTPDISKLAPAAKTIAQRTDAKLKRMSQQITRGTPAANPSPFKKKSS